jgi:DNA-binding response OmpR family regulator
VLIVDDDQRAVEMISLYLEREGYQVLKAYSGTSALDLARSASPDLIVLDLMLPGIGGLDICRLLRQESEVPIIMLTARSTEDDKLKGLGLGADDYITKPFSPRELVARIKTVLRRSGGKAANADGAEEVSYGPLTVSFRRYEATIAGRPVPLTPSEFRILGALVREQGRVLSRQQLLELAFGYDFEGVDRNVDVHVVNVRRKLGFGSDGPIKAVYGIGYKFEVNEIVG